MMKWNREMAKTCSSLFETNKPNLLDGQRAPLHLACSFPSLSLITDLISDNTTNALVLDSRLKLPSELVPENYLSSWKIMYKFEISKFVSFLQTPLFVNGVDDLQSIDEHVSFTKVENRSQLSCNDFDDAGSSGPSSCTKYASTKKRKFMLDLLAFKSIGHQKNLMMQQPTQAPHNSPKIEFKNLGNPKLNLVKVAGIHNGSYPQPFSLKKISVSPQPPRMPSTELSLEEVMNKIGESNQEKSSKIKAIKFSIKAPKGFKTNLDISGRKSADPPSIFSDFSENALDQSTANKSSIQKTLTNLISTSRINGSGMKKIQANNQTNASAHFIKPTPSTSRIVAAQVPFKSGSNLIERALLQISILTKKLISTAKLGLLKTTFNEAYIEEIGKHMKIIELWFLFSGCEIGSMLAIEKDPPFSNALQNSLSLLKELIANFASERGAEILIFKHTFLQLIREFSIMQPLNSMLSLELSELFVGLKRKVNKLQDPVSKSNLSLAELLLETALEVITVQAKLNMSSSQSSCVVCAPPTSLQDMNKTSDNQPRRTKRLRQNLGFPNSFFQRQQIDTGKTGLAQNAPDQSVNLLHGSLQESHQIVNFSSAGLS
jgi:hypothetical protein